MRTGTFLSIFLGCAALAGPAFADPAPSEPGRPDPAKPLTVPVAPPAPATGSAAAPKASAGDDGEQARRRARADARANDRRAFGEARLAALRAGLQLTPEQQPLWSPVEGALRDLGEARRALHRGRRDMVDGADGTARLKERSRRMVAMGEAMGRLADAAAPFSAALAPEQKGRLPVLLCGVAPRRVVADAFGVDVERGGMARMGMDRRDGGDDGRDGMRREQRGRRFGESFGADEREGRPGWSRRSRFERYGDGRFEPEEGGRSGDEGGRFGRDDRGGGWRRDRDGERG